MNLFGTNEQFYHSEKLQSTKTYHATPPVIRKFYHSEKLQSTKTTAIKQ